MMNFDNIIVPPCVNPNASAGKVTNCDSDIPPAQPNECADPIFAAANPGLCLLSPRLIVKPEYVVREVGKSVQFKAFLWINGAEEELTTGVTWSTSSMLIAAIGTADGNATGLAPGIVSIAAAYGILNGFAQLEVIEEGACATSGNTYVIVLDNSASGGSPFSSMYASRLSFAKETAKKFVDAIDFLRDKAVVIAFSGSAAVILAQSTDATALKVAINSVALTPNLTNVQSALQLAQETLVTGRRVIILFTDCDNKEGDDPVVYAESIQGPTIIIGVGLRASGTGFRQLNRIASGGFFVNALPANQASVYGWLTGMQSYLCSGNCSPVGDVIIGVGELNYDRFLLWDVIHGHVDLIGKNVGGPEEYDLAPGHGLYVDGCGSSINGNGDPDLGKIRTKDLIAVTAGHQLVLKVAIGGNKRENRTPDVTTISLVNQVGVTVASLVCSVTNREQTLTDYTLNYTVGGGVTGVRIVIEQTSIAAGGFGAFGNLWDNVRLTDHTAADAALFTDTFDGENATYIPPNCGQGVLMPNYYGSCYGYGCLTSPIPAQYPDAAPLPDLEA